MSGLYRIIEETTTVSSFTSSDPKVRVRSLISSPKEGSCPLIWLSSSMRYPAIYAFLEIGPLIGTVCPVALGAFFISESIVIVYATRWAQSPTAALGVLSVKDYSKALSETATGAVIYMVCPSRWTDLGTGALKLIVF